MTRESDYIKLHDTLVEIKNLLTIGEKDCTKMLNIIDAALGEDIPIPVDYVKENE